MEIQTIVIFCVMAIMLIGIGFLIFRTIKSVRDKREYENDELPDPDDVEDEEETLPDIEESGFSKLVENFDLDDENSSEMRTGSYSDDDD